MVACIKRLRPCLNMSQTGSSLVDVSGGRSNPRNIAFEDYKPLLSKNQTCSWIPSDDVDSIPKNTQMKRYEHVQVKWGGVIHLSPKHSKNYEVNPNINSSRPIRPPSFARKTKENGGLPPGVPHAGWRSIGIHRSQQQWNHLGEAESPCQAMPRSLRSQEGPKHVYNYTSLYLIVCVRIVYMNNNCIKCTCIL